MTQQHTVRLAAPAKINALLRVTERRDDGYHAIDTVFVALALADEITLSKEPSGIRGATHMLDPRLPSHDLRGMDPDNLAYRAAQLWLEAAGLDAGVRIEVGKRIPIAGGLGGGSSDAAAVLQGMNRLYGALDEDVLGRVALALGSDVPFFLSGWSAARGRGRGERLEPVSLPRRSIVLANPGVAVSAGFAYRQLEGFGQPLDAALAGLWEGESQQTAPRNDLERGVRQHVSEVQTALGALQKAGLAEVTLSGSGATVFGLAAGPNEAERAAEAITNRHPNWWVAVTEGPAIPDAEASF